MSDSDASTAVVTSALVVFGVYGYRRVIQGSEGGTGSGLGSLVGIGPPAKGGSFITAWGFTFFVIAMMATISPDLGGTFAWLVLVADLLANGIWIFGNVNNKVGK